MTTETEITKHAGFRIHRAADARDLADTGFNAGNDFSAHPEIEPAARALGEAKGAVSKVLVAQTPEEGGFSLVYLFFKPGFPLFRHHHETDCLYLVLSGTAIMGNQTLRAGDSFYAGTGAPYWYTAGPEGVEVLEIRHNADKFTVIFNKNPDSRVAEALEVAEANAELWKSIVTGPMLAANAANAANAAGDAASASGDERA